MQNDRGESILTQTLDMIFQHHGKGQADGMAVLNRLLFKAIHGRNPENGEEFSFNANQIKSSKEMWTTDELKTLMGTLPISHQKDTPRTQHGTSSPIAVVNYKGTRYLIDGSNRINMWANGNNTDLHEVNVHVIEDDKKHDALQSEDLALEK